MTMNYARSDRETVTQHYATDEKLAVRYRTHERYTVPKIDFTRWVLDHITWRGDEQVLDLGAGPGMYFEAVKARIPDGQHFAGDLSLGMVRREQESPASEGSSLANIDAQGLPFASNTFDVVLANHMLYHVPGLQAATREIRRVLKPTGVLLAATNSINNMPELNNLYRRALLLLTEFRYNEQEQPSPAENFSLENASMLLGRQFYAVARYDLPSALVFQEAGPVIAYLDSMRDMREPMLPDGITWETYMDVIRHQIISLLTHSGRLVVKKLAGVLVATDAGGFAADFVSRLT